jgi:hypothetical protein
MTVRATLVPISTLGVEQPPRLALPPPEDPVSSGS